MNIPLVDLYAQYLSIRHDIDSAIERVITRSTFIGGEDVRDFEIEFARYCRQREHTSGAAANLYCASCGNGTDALCLALHALGIGTGDEVITTAHTFIATAEAISSTGAKPVFVDIEEDTFVIDPKQIEAAITPNTRAIIPVHLYGQACDMDAILEIARRRDLKVIEDAAQAHGATWHGKRVGSFGHAACFSFYPGKNLGAYGDAGAVVSQDEDLIRRIRMRANHGRLDKYVHEMEGVSSRLDGLNAAVLRVKLRHLDAWNAARQQHAARYMEVLRGSGVVLPAVRFRAEPVWHLFVIKVRDRDRVRVKLQQQGVSTGVHYPLPLHRQPAYKHLAIPDGALPVTNRVATEILSLPMYPELSPDQIDGIGKAVIEALEP